MKNTKEYQEWSEKAAITIIGTGTLGRRIAMMFATQGNEVRIYDKNVEALDKAKTYINENLETLLPKIKNSKKGTFETFQDLEAAVNGAWLIIEAIPEIKDAKIELLGNIDKYADADAIITTNSSSYPSSFLSENIVHKARFLNTHFMMPPDAKAVELMSCGETNEAIIQFLEQRFKDYGLSPYVVLKESQGFIYNRIWAAIKREALYELAQGVSTPETIDAICQETLGTKNGIFRMMDMVGLDVVLDIEENYAKNRPGLPEEPRILLRKMVAENKLGVKSGEGFYNDYDKK